jgi:long-chain fatty acid transport protein
MKLRPRTQLSAPLLALLSLTGQSLHAAETLGTVPDSAAALGMSGGRYANLTDPSALHYTPANIADLTRPEAELNYALWYGDVRFTQAGTGDSVKMEDPWKMLGSFYSAYPIIPGKLVFGLGVTTPFGLDSHWPKKGPVKYLIPYEATLVTLDINPVLAFKPVENVAIGIGLDIMYSSLELKQLYPWSMAVPGLPLPDGTVHFEGDGWGLGAFAGITWKITPRQRISLIGRLPLEIEYNGDFNASDLPSFTKGTGVTSHSDFKSSIRFPASIAAGYGLDVTDRLTVGIDFLWADNSSHDDVPLDIGNNQSLLGVPGQQLNWKDAITIGTGLQYHLDDHWTLRAGYMYSTDSQRDSTYTPSVPSNERHLMSAGVGYRSARHSLDLAYSYSLFPDRTVTGDSQPAFNGKYEMGWHVVTTSYSFRF